MDLVTDVIVFGRSDSDLKPAHVYIDSFDLVVGIFRFRLLYTLAVNHQLGKRTNTDDDDVLVLNLD